MKAAYYEIEPRAELRSYIACTWVSAVEPITERNREVLPDGCVDIIQPIGMEPFIAGPDTEARPAGIAAGMTLIGIRFLPGVAGALLGMPLSEITNRTVALNCIWRPAEVRELLGHVAEAASPREIARRMEDYIVRRLRRRGVAPDPLVQAAIGAILRSTLSGRRERQECSDVSERHFRRRFVASVGYGPKTFERIARFRHFLRIAQIRRDLRLAGLAAEAGYSDQPHLTRECARLGGRTPRELVAMKPMSDLFKIVSEQTVNMGG